jgi:hypothetical protein
MLAIAIGAALLLGGLLLLYAFANARPAAVKTALVWGLGTLGAVGVTAMLLSGRGANALWALIMFGPALLQAFRGWRARHTFGRPAESGEASGVETETLEMRLDLGSGAMSGRVRRGAFQGRDLASMDRMELIALLSDCQAMDAESVPLIEAWLDRTDPEWRDAAPPPQAASNGRMTRGEALSVLGLSEGASEEQIRAAHRRLMQSAHPDRGGSDWLASRVNEARDLLVG